MRSAAHPDSVQVRTRLTAIPSCSLLQNTSESTLTPFRGIALMTTGSAKVSARMNSRPRLACTCDPIIFTTGTASWEETLFAGLEKRGGRMKLVFEEDVDGT
jgi:hypothetical protein